MEIAIVFLVGDILLMFIPWFHVLDIVGTIAVTCEVTVESSILIKKMEMIQLASIGFLTSRSFELYRSIAYNYMFFLTS